MMLIIQIAKLKFHQYQMRAVSRNLTLAKVTHSGADPGPQEEGGGEGAKVNNCAQSVCEKSGHAHFNETTPT